MNDGQKEGCNSLESKQHAARPDDCYQSVSIGMRVFFVLCLKNKTFLHNVIR